MRTRSLAWIILAVVIGSLIINSDAKRHKQHKKSKGKHREKRFFFDPNCPDLCHQKVDLTNSCSGTLFLHKYYYNALTMTCTKYLYPGCGANTNSFDSLIECQNTCGGCSVAPPAPTGAGGAPAPPPVQVPLPGGPKPK